jgi:hypothetical protein
VSVVLDKAATSQITLLYAHILKMFFARLAIKNGVPVVELI